MHRVAGPRQVGSRESWVQQSITPSSPTSSCAPETTLHPPSLFSPLTTALLWYLVFQPHQPPNTKAPSYLRAFAPAMPAAGNSRLFPCPPKSCSSTGAPLTGLPGARFLPPEKSLTCSLCSVGARGHAALVVGSLSTHLPPFSAPKGMSFLRARLSDCN